MTLELKYFIQHFAAIDVISGKSIKDGIRDINQRNNGAFDNSEILSHYQKDYEEFMKYKI